MLVPRRHDSLESYKYGFQGQEKDDEVKGEGNSLNYTFRMQDPRVGKFLSLDPLAPKYPHNSPYVFSENRVIDGTELEGLEYLSKEKSMMEMRFGRVFLKLENFGTPFRNAFIKANPNYQLFYYDRVNPGQVSPQLYFSIPAVQLENNLVNLDKGKIGKSPGENVFSAPAEKRFEKDNYKVFTGKRNLNGSMNGNSKKSDKNFQPGTSYSEKTLSSGVPANKIAVGAAGVVELLNMSLETYYNYSTGSDWIEFSEQFHDFVSKEKGNSFSRESIFSKVNSDMTNAISDGVLDGFTLGEVDQVFNFVLYGGDKGQSNKVIEAGKFIINNYSSSEAKLRLWSTESCLEIIELFTEPINTESNGKKK